MTPLHPYAPFIPGTSQTFSVFDIEGEFDSKSGYFGITKQTPHANSPQQISVLERGALRARVYHRPGTPPIIQPGVTLYQGRWQGDVTEVAGTCIAQGAGIPILSDLMEYGRVLEGDLPITHFGTDGEPLDFSSYHFKRFTHHVGKSWASWPDTIRTCLLENSVGQKQVPIAYVFAKGIGPVDFWRGELQADGKTVLNGQRYYCTSH